MVNPNSAAHFPIPRPSKLTSFFRGKSSISRRSEEEDERDAQNLRTADVSEERIDAGRSHRENRSFEYVGAGLVDSGVRCQNQGELQKALKHFNTALKMQRMNIESPDHISIAHTLGNIGAVQLQQGDLLQAKVMLKEAARMIIRIRTRNANHPSPDLIVLSDILMNLGSTAFMQGQIDDSMRYYIEACKEIRLQPPTISARQALAHVLYNMGRIHILNRDWEAAMAVIEESYEIVCGIHGDDSVQVVDSLNLTGFVQLCSSSFPDASESFTKCLWINILFYGPNHPEVAASWFNIAHVRAARGDLEDALKACETAREMYNQVGLQFNSEIKALTKLESEIRDQARNTRKPLL